MSTQIIDAFPLQWPSGWKRVSYRSPSRFDVSFARARDSLFSEIRRMGGRNVVLSTNIELRQDGIPYANRRAPDDPGVAVYFQYKNKPMVLACDKWRKVEDNTWALCKTIDAIRGIERWGASDMLERAFSGFQALPAPQQQKGWWDVLEVNRRTTYLPALKDARDRLALKHHPDHGGSAAAMAEINRAYDEAIREAAGGQS